MLLHDGLIEILTWPVNRAAAIAGVAGLSAQEAARAKAYAQDADRDRFVTGRLALRRALAARTGSTPADVTISIEPDGRPASPAGIPFSLSHSGQFVMLAIAAAGTAPAQFDLGVDIERIDGLRDVAKLAARVCTPSELAWLDLARSGATDRFYDLWVRKESALKALGTGLMIEPQEASYCPASRQVVISRAGHASAKLLSCTIEAPQGYRAAMAISPSALEIAGQ